MEPIFNGIITTIYKCSGTMFCLQKDCSTTTKCKFQKLKKNQKQLNQFCKKCNECYECYECNHIVIVIHNSNILHDNTFTTLVIKINQHSKQCYEVPIKSATIAAQTLVCNICIHLFKLKQ